jgi:hypothetical protein
MRLSGRLQGRLLTASPRPPKQSLKMWWRILWGAEVASELVPEVVREEAPTEGAMIAVHRATVSGAATGKGMEVVLGHPTPYAPGDISVGEVMSTAHHALSQAQRILHREGEDLADECRRLQLWASMLKRMTVSERVVARA